MDTDVTVQVRPDLFHLTTTYGSKRTQKGIHFRFTILRHFIQMAYSEVHGKAELMQRTKYNAEYLN
jgi:gamma-glutamylcysteine synthetase